MVFLIESRRLTKRIIVPEGVEVSIDGALTVKGPKGEIKRLLSYPTIEVKKEERDVVIEPKRFTKREKKIINTFRAHVNNMIKGVQEPFQYEVKICSSHFPMSVKIEGKELVVKNFYGEKVPRRADIMEGVKVNIDGDLIKIEGSDIEKVGQTAANFEKSTRITNRDRRIFQDGLWIIKKAK